MPKRVLDKFDDYERWVSIIGLLPLDGQFLEVMGEPEHGPFNYNYPSGAFLKSVFGREGLMCTFDSRLHESYSPEKPETKQSCAALLSDGSEVVEPDLDVPVGVTQDMFRADKHSTDPFFWDFYPLGTLKIDVDGDGTVEHLIKVTGAPGHGRCYGKTYYDVLDSSDPTKFSTAPVRELVRNAQSSSPPCGYEVRIRRAGSRVLFEVAGSGLGEVRKQGMPIMAKRAGLLSRDLREISSGEVKHLCSTIFGVEPVVTYAR
ncbi:MAG: hypothetical protein QM773_13000 [Hyphomonadaceae bacterium]